MTWSGSPRDAIAKGPLEPNRALHVIREIASALAVAHRSGVVHRDLKPENVMLVSRGTEPEAVKVFDFGIAKIDVSSVTGKQGSTLQPITRVGTVFGTPDYMAPEQAMGQPVDGRADIYSLGVLLFEMLAGSRPFKGGAVTLMRQHILQEVPDLPPAIAQGIDARIAEIVKRCLAKDADERYATAADLVAAIDEILGRALSAPPPAATSSARPLPQSGPPAAGEAGQVTSSVALTPIAAGPAAHPSWKPAPAAYSAEASTKRKRRALAWGVGAIVGSGLIAVAVVSLRPAPHAGRTGATPRPSESAVTTGALPSDTASAVASEAPSGETAPTAVAPPSAVSAAPAASENPEPAASVERGADPVPTTKPVKPAKGANGKGQKQQPRRTGPGGIYIPPPKDWLK